MSSQNLSPGHRAVFAPLQDGEGVIVDTETAFYYGLNRTAAFLWESLQTRGEMSSTQLTETLCQRFDVTIAEATRDVEDFLGQLKRFDLVNQAGR